MKKILILTLLILASIHAGKAQCASPNTAFRSGETLMYDLYFNWKFIWVKAGTATMNITNTTYQGLPCFRTRLITRGSKKADAFFVMRDTLVSYVDTNLTPRYYRKNAREGDAYRVDEVWYNYPAGRSAIRQRHVGKDGKIRTGKKTSTTCIFDMLSMLLRARSFDISSYRPGHRIVFWMADGKNCDRQTLVYRGKEKFTVEHSNITYRCLVFSFVENDGNKEKDVVTFYVTDDDNHLPVRLDLNLNFGTAKAYLTGSRGLRNPVTARVK